MWGRRAAYDRDAVERIAWPAEPEPETPETLDFVTKRIKDLTQYQDSAYARRYADMIDRVRVAEADKAKGQTGLADAVARAYFKLLAYKDEYEVARLYTDGEFIAGLRRQFGDGFKLAFHLAPPLVSPRDLDTGELKKREFGSWVMTAFKVLARLKGLRGTPFDIFGITAERRMERRLIGEYEAVVMELVDGLNADNHALAAEIAELPMRIRGFGHVKERNRRTAKDCEEQLLTDFRGSGMKADAAE